MLKRRAECTVVVQYLILYVRKVCILGSMLLYNNKFIYNLFTFCTWGWSLVIELHDDYLFFQQNRKTESSYPEKVFTFRKKSTGLPLAPIRVRVPLG